MTHPRLKQHYQDEVSATLMREFGYGNVMQVPRVEKVVVNIGLGEATQNAKALDAASEDLARAPGRSCRACGPAVTLPARPSERLLRVSVTWTL